MYSSSIYEDRETEIKKKWLAQDQILSGEAWLCLLDFRG